MKHNTITLPESNITIALEDISATQTRGQDGSTLEVILTSGVTLKHTYASRKKADEALTEVNSKWANPV